MDLQPGSDPIHTCDPNHDRWQLFDGSHDMESVWYDTFAAALQGGRSLRWRFQRWIIFHPDSSGGGIARRFDSGEEFEHWRDMSERGLANIGPIPLFK